MRKMILVVFSVILVFSVTLAFADKGTKGMFNAKAGDEIYVCACGESCKCGTLAKKEGNCGCGQKLVKATVTKVEKGTVFYKIGDKEVSSPQKGKYECGCGEGCNCGFISQKGGQCGCGMDMIKVK